MAGVKLVWMTLLVVVLLAVAGGSRVEAAEMQHHVVGDDRGWEPTTDIASWFAGRVFRVGDILWFTYSAAQESIVELETLEEFMSCDLKNPTRMYNDGLVKIPLENQGTRYFASSNLHSCRNGLKLPVKVHPITDSQEVAAAVSPTPSASSILTGLSSLFFVGLLLCYLSL